MFHLTDAQDFFSNVVKLINVKQYPHSIQIINSFIALPVDFLELEKVEIEKKNKSERKKYYISSTNNKKQIPSIEERQNYIFTQFFSIYEIINKETPFLIRLIYKFSEFLTIQKYSIVISTQKIIWSILLVENIKYDIRYMQNTLMKDLIAFNDVAHVETSALSNSLIFLEKQFQNINYSPTEHFNKYELLSIAKLIKIIRNQLLKLIKNKSIKSYTTILTLEKWNTEMGKHLQFIAENLYLAKSIPNEQRSLWDKSDHNSNITLTYISAILILVSLITIIFGSKSHFHHVLIGITFFLVLNIFRELIKSLILNSKYSLPLTLMKLKNIVVTTLLSPILLIITSCINPTETIDKFKKLINKTKCLCDFCYKNLLSACISDIRKRSSEVKILLIKKLPFQIRSPLKPVKLSDKENHIR